MRLSAFDEIWFSNTLDWCPALRHCWNLFGPAYAKVQNPNAQASERLAVGFTHVRIGLVFLQPNGEVHWRPQNSVYSRRPLVPGLFG
jgi:hypothetical protein